jgi:hypothetical protein
VLETLTHLQRLTAYGVEWRSLTEQYLDSCGIFRDAVLSILATIAKQERVRIVERINAGLDRAWKQGKTFGRPRLVVDRAKVRKLRAAGYSLSAIRPRDEPGAHHGGADLQGSGVGYFRARSRRTSRAESPKAVVSREAGSGVLVPVDFTSSSATSV